MLIPYWNRSGEVHQLEPCPSSFQDWAQGEEAPPHQRALHDAVQDITNHTIVRTSCRAMDMNMTLDATLDDGRSFIVRQRHTYPSDPVLEGWSHAKFRNEVRLLRWLKENSTLPVPTVIAVGSDFMILEKMPGSTVTLEWHFLSDKAKAHFLTMYLDAVIEIFHLPAIQRIGSASFEPDSIDTLSVGPRIAPSPSYSSSQVFDNITEYLIFLISAKRQAITDMEVEDQERAGEALSFIEEKITILLKNIDDPSLLRCVFTHADLHTYNILVTQDGNITAILDWEINYVQPAVLAVDYPGWLLDKGPFDPQFSSKDYWWDESPTERRRLSLEFEQSIQERDSVLHRCLVEGRDLRAVVAWLTDTSLDPGFDRMRAWAYAALN
ncbi:kinase-like domain-containing protein [Gymnopilus junonius]|uniref:Kinase-like domain-containing protein n=1 Tax=Gymnopilus junonius TaxID=109634 RepID=A0A9P5NKI6_GYMJU|nr:kinase-like domain-containing protein [Gymnopilus junonius]